MAAPDVNVCYSLPRMISPAIQCSFLTYMWEMYTTEFGWSMAEYGTVQTLYSRTQIFSFLILGLIFLAIKEINGTKGILVGGTILHSITYFFLIFLPIKWHGVKTPYVDSMLGNTLRLWTLDFWKPMFKGPVALSSMATSRGWFRFFCIPWCFVKLFWIILYIPMKVCFLCIVNFGAILWALTWPFRKAWFGLRLPYTAIKNRMRSGSIRFPYEPVPYIKPYERPKPLANPDPNNILIDHRRLPPRAPFRPKNYPDASAMPDIPVDFDLLRQIWAMPVPEPRPVYVGDIPIISSPLVNKILPVLETLESIPPPTCSACCNTTCCNNFAMRLTSWKTFMGTKTFCIYMLVFANGVGMSMHELSNKALESYVGFDAIDTNLSFFFVSNVLLFILFSLLKFYCRSKSFFSEIFYLLAIMFFILQIPILPVFIWKTTGNYTPDGITGPWQSRVCLCLKWLSTTIFHSTVVFLIFSGGPLISYVAIFILGGHKGLMSFGVLVLFGALNGMSFLSMTLGALKKGENPFDPKTQMIVAAVCILLQLLTFMIFIPFDWSWNKGNWFNCIIMILTGAVNSKFVAYANYMLGVGVTSDVRARKGAWLFFGGFYSGTNVVVSTAMPRIFNAFGKDEMKNVTWRCIQFHFSYNFPVVYKTITLLFIVLNLIAFGIYVFVHFVDQLIAAIYKFVYAAKRFQKLAKEFQTAANEIPGASGTVQTAIEKFQEAANIFGYKTNPGGRNDISAAGMFEDIGAEFQKFADEIANPLYWIELLIYAKAFKTHASTFKIAASNPPNDGFLEKAETFVEAAKAFHDNATETTFQAAANAFQTLGDKFYAASTALDGASSKFTTAAGKIKGGSLPKLSNQTSAFKAKAGEDTQATLSGFKACATQFQSQAGSVKSPGDNTHLETIKTKFLAAAEKFGAAANAFNEAAQAFSGILP